MLISVIIPTFNRSRTLKECLKALEKQTIPKADFEVIVVDDGSRDDTKKVAEEFSDKLQIKYIYQKNSGQGVARNRGVSRAEGNIIVLIGDDNIVISDFLAEHLKFHLKYDNENEAVLGFTDWHPKLTVTPFMRWLTNGSSIFGKFGGHQFAYEKLKGKLLADYNFFYTINISLKKSLLQKFPFDPDFSGYGWEDIELGYRLFKRVALKIYYNPDAIGYHDHAMAEESLKTRMFDVGKSVWLLDKKWPELHKVPGFSKNLVFRILSNPFILGFLKILRYISQGRICNLYFYCLSKKYFLDGVHSITN